MKKILIAIMCIVLIICYMPIMAFAEGSGTSGGTDIYVSDDGNDAAEGTKADPYASLAKAAEVVNDSPGENFTVHVMSNLKSTKCARFYSKNVTIVGEIDGEGTTVPVVSRGDDFATIDDTARSWYNPAMVEVQTSEGPASLTLKNIIFDDCGKHKGSKFAQAISGEGEKDNTVYVQDAIVASNATEDCTVTLGEGAVLRNYGGMSAVRVTDKAKLVMESGSKIIDTTVTNRVKGKDDNGPAGAVWIQGGSFVMNEGAEISNMIGRGVYADGGKVSLGGTISGITASKNMWQGTSGIALHLRNNAVGTLIGTCVIDNSGIKNGADSAICTNGCDLSVENGCVIKNLTNTIGIAVGGKCTVNFDGEITGMVGSSNALNLQNAEFQVTIGKNAYIHDNHTGYGTIYIQAQNGKLDIYGKINNNIASDRGGAIAMANNFKYPTIVTMYDGAEICNNYSAQTGGGIMVSVGVFTMKGGTISGNSSGLMGGGVYVRRGGLFIMEGGTISDNTTAAIGGGIAYEAQDYNGGIANVELKGGRICNNKQGATLAVDNATNSVIVNGGESNDLAVANTNYSYTARNLYITDNVNITDLGVFFATNTKTVTPEKDSLNIKLGNASPNSIKALKTDAAAKGWSEPLATFWMQRSQAATLTVGGLNDKINDERPIYAMALPVGEDGNPEENADVKVYVSQITDEGIKLTIPEGNTNGYAVALVQPTEDFGNVVITTSKSQIDKNKDKTADGNYEIPYTATYTMSKNLKENIELLKDRIDDNNCEFTFTVELDKRLTAKSGAGDYKFTSPIFELKEFTVADDGSTVIAKCKLKADWKNHIDELLETPMVLTGTGVLGAEDFTLGDTINTTGHIKVSISAGNLNIYIPANVCQTLMKEEITPGPGTDPQDPGNTDEGAPKTGDATSMTLLIGLFMLAVAALAGSIFLKKSSTKK